MVFYCPFFRWRCLIQRKSGGSVRNKFPVFIISECSSACPTWCKSWCAMTLLLSTSVKIDRFWNLHNNGVAQRFHNRSLRASSWRSCPRGGWWMLISSSFDFVAKLKRKWLHMALCCSERCAVGGIWPWIVNEIKTGLSMYHTASRRLS